MSDMGLVLNSLKELKDLKIERLARLEEKLEKERLKVDRLNTLIANLTRSLGDVKQTTYD